MQVTDTGVPVTSLIDAVKAAVTETRISSNDSDRRMRVVEIRLTLNAVATTTGGAKLEFKIPFIGMSLGFGASVTRVDTHTIDITLVPPDLMTLPPFAGHIGCGVSDLGLTPCVGLQT